MCYLVPAGRVDIGGWLVAWLQQIAKIVEGLCGVLGLLHNGDPTDRAEIYARVGLQMTYRPGTEQ